MNGNLAEFYHGRDRLHILSKFEFGLINQLLPMCEGVV